MDLEIFNLADEDSRENESFLENINSNLVMDFSKNEIVDNTEWVDQVLFTVPYLVKAFDNANKNIITEEEVIKVELIKKVTVESVKHLSKHVNYVSELNEETGEVIPEKILNVNREESYITYENRFLYTLTNLIDDFIMIRNREAKKNLASKGKNKQKASYEATSKVRKEKITIKLDYSSERITGEKNDHDIEQKIMEIQNAIRSVKATSIYRLLNSKGVILVQSPLKMTNVLLKNVNYQYAVKLWNYLNDNFDMKNKANTEKKQIKDKGVTKKMIDQSVLLDYIIFNTVNLKQNNELAKKVKLTNEERKEISDDLLNKLFAINQEMPENELKKMVVKKYIQYKKSLEASTKPIKNRIKEEITKYILRINKMKISNSNKSKG